MKQRCEIQEPNHYIVLQKLVTIVRNKGKEEGRIVSGHFIEMVGQTVVGYTDFEVKHNIMSKQWMNWESIQDTNHPPDRNSVRIGNGDPADMGDGTFIYSER